MFYMISRSLLLIAVPWIILTQPGIALQTRGGSIEAEPPENSKPRSTRNAQLLNEEPPRAVDALFEIVNVLNPHYSSNVTSSEILKNPERRDVIKRLVRFLRHPDERVRLAAFDTLTAIQPDRPGQADSPEAWEKWLQGRTDLLGIEEPVWIVVGWKPSEDIIFDIIKIRTRFPMKPKIWILREPDRHEAFKRLIAYLRHPDRGVRSAAYMTIIGLQEDCPGGPDNPAVWEIWIENLAKAARAQDGSKSNLPNKAKGGSRPSGEGHRE